MKESLWPPFTSHELEAKPAFLGFLLANPAIANADPFRTTVYFDLDETMFKRSTYSASSISGSWREDMPETLARLKERGFGLSVLSSAGIDYIKAAVAIYGQQFGTEASFDDLLSTRDHDVYGDKHVALPEVAALAASEGKAAVFVDDAHLAFDEPTDFGFIQVPADMQYQGNPAVSFEAALV